MSLSKYLLIGVGIAVTGAAIHYLRKQTETERFNPKVHTVNKLREILDELYLD